MKAVNLINEDPPAEVLLNDFRDLLLRISQDKSNVAIRLKRSGDGWTARFMQVMDVSKGVALYDHLTGEFAYVTDLADVTAFELDTEAGIFKAHIRYTIVPLRFV
jgi:hypothetical protein